MVKVVSEIKRIPPSCTTNQLP